MTVRRRGPADYVTMPWANGRGTTLELVREDLPEGTGGAAPFLWRLSMADVVEDGDFSPLAGVDRILTLVEGPGFDLDFGPHGRAPLEPFVPVAFSGDWSTRAENVRGASRDLNLMVARGHAAATVTVHHAGRFAAGPADRLVCLALAGRWRAEVAGGAHDLAPGEFLLAHGEMVAGDGEGVLVLVAVTFAARSSA